MIKLKNKNIEASITTNPLEVVSIKYLGEEIIYQQNSDWKKSWPILFPVCGNIHELFHNKKPLGIKRHGFFREINNWKILNNENDYIKFEYISENKFYEIYPFKFKLIVEFKLIENTFELNIFVKNLENQIMYFSIGHHPGFIFNENSNLDLTNENLFSSSFENGFITSMEKNIKIKSFGFNDFDFSNSKSYFTNEFKKDNVKINNGKISFEIESKDFKDLTLWRESNQCNFVCVEHWNGYPDLFNLEAFELKDKQGNIFLNPNEEKKFALKIKF